MIYKLSVFCLGLLLLSNTTKTHAVNINFGANGCTLQDAIRSANNDSAVGNCSSGSGNDILISPDVWIISLNSQLPTITSDMTIRTATPSGTLDITGNSNRIMKVTGSNTNLTLQRVYFHDASRSNVANGGSAIRIIDAQVSIVDSWFSNNTDFSGTGGAINVENGTLTIQNSYFGFNLSTVIFNILNPNVGKGGAIYAINSNLDISTTTFTFNRAQVISNNDGNQYIDYTKGSSIYLQSGELNFVSSLIQEEFSGIFANDSVVNTSNATFAKSTVNQFAYMLEVWGFSTLTINHVTFASPISVQGDTNVVVTNSIIDHYCDTGEDINVIVNSQNFDTSNPYSCSTLTTSEGETELLTLRDNGGATKTQALRYTSEAINFGNPAYCLATDQRGIARDALCDAGAYEATGIADLSASNIIITSTTQGSNFVHGQSLNYTAKIINNSPVIATAFEVDIATSNASIGNVNSSLCSSFPCIVDVIQPFQTISIPLTLTLSSFASSFDLDLSINRTANSQYIDPDISNNTINTSGTLLNAADLSIDMNLISQGDHFIGQVIEYKATITNLGVDIANAPVVDFNPTGLNSVSFVGCDSVAGQSCTINTLINGGSRDITINAQITASEFDAVAIVSSSTLDVYLDNNTDERGNGGALDKSDLSVTGFQVDFPSAPYYSDDFIRFIVKVSTGANPATNVRVYSDYEQSEFITCNFVFVNTWCEIGSIPANSTVNVIFSYYNPISQPGIQTSFNHQVFAVPGETDPDLSNNDAELMVNIAPLVEMISQLTLTTQGPYTEGQEIEFNLRVANAGINTATPIEVNLIPNNLNLLWARGDSCLTVDCVINALSLSTEENITLHYQIINPGSFSLESNVSAPQHEFDYDNNTEAVTANAEAAPVIDVIFLDSFE